MNVALQQLDLGSREESLYSLNMGSSSWDGVMFWFGSSHVSLHPFLDNRQFLPYEILFFSTESKALQYLQNTEESLLSSKLKVFFIYQRAVDQQRCVFHIVVYSAGKLCLPWQVAWTIWWVAAPLAHCPQPNPKAGWHIPGLSPSLQRADPAGTDGWTPSSGDYRSWGCITAPPSLAAVVFVDKLAITSSFTQNNPTCFSQ